MYTIQTGRDRSFMKGDSVQKRLQSSSCHQRDFGYKRTIVCASKSVENTSTKNTNNEFQRTCKRKKKILSEFINNFCLNCEQYMQLTQLKQEDNNL